jgi:hypothetical protein
METSRLATVTDVRVWIVLTVALVGLAPASAIAAAPTPWWTQLYGPDVQVHGGWEPIVGDFGGSDDDDIIWYSPGLTPEQLWTSDGDGTFTKSGVARNVTGDYRPLVGNFGGDQRDDIFWYSDFTHESVLWITNDSSDGVKVVRFRIAGRYIPTVLTNTAGRDTIAFQIVQRGSQAPVWTFTGSEGSVVRASIPDQGLFARYLAGDFNGDGWGDIFQYQLADAPDQVSFGQADHEFSTTAEHVAGVYEPVVADVDAGGDGRDDIVWYNVYRYGDDLVDPIWHGTADDGFTASFAALNDGGFPLLASTPEHFVEIGDFFGSDHIWYVDGTGEHSRATSNSAVFKEDSDTVPIVGSFTNGTPDIFRYVPGKGRDILYAR